MVQYTDKLVLKHMPFFVVHLAQLLRSLSAYGPCFGPSIREIRQPHSILQVLKLQSVGVEFLETGLLSNPALSDSVSGDVDHSSGRIDNVLREIVDVFNRVSSNPGSGTTRTNGEDLVDMHRDGAVSAVLTDRWRAVGVPFVVHIPSYIQEHDRGKSLSVDIVALPQTARTVIFPVPVTGWYQAQRVRGRKVASRGGVETESVWIIEAARKTYVECGASSSVKEGRESGC
jgi:hypothetical protein